MNSAMHSCFAVQEILLQIIEACVYPAPSSSAPYQIYPTLAALARTCKMFRDPVLDRMWRRQEGLQNLIKCLPPPYWRINSDNSKLIVDQDVDLEDWERFDFYACRVYELSIDQHGHCDQSELFAPLIRRSGSRIMFPNLTFLKWWSAPQKPLPQIQLVLGPKLRYLIASFAAAPASASGLTYIPKYSPHIETLRLYLSDEIVIAKFGKVLPEMQKLRSLTLTIRDDIADAAPPPLNELFNKLSALPRLEFFYTCPLPGRISLIQMPKVSTRFPALRQLCIESREAWTESPFLRTFGLENLQHLDVFPSLPAPPDDNAFAMLQTIQEVISHTSLKVLHLTYRTNVTVTLASIRPAFAFSNLEEFCLYSGTTGVALDDTAVEKLAQAWGGLIELRILGSIPLNSEAADVPVLPTLQALTYLAQHCPRLETLGIELDATNVTPLGRRRKADRRVSNPRMTHLSVRRSPIEDTARVAAFISDLFPNLTDIAGARDGWADVAKCLKAIQVVRSWSQLGEL